MTSAIEAQIERFAPGFRGRILARSVRGPSELERYNPNLVGAPPLPVEETRRGFVLQYGADSLKRLDALKSKFPAIKVISSDQHAGPTRETAYQASQNILNRFGRQAQGVFCPNETSTIAMTKALRDIGQAGGKVKMIGFDAGSQSVADLKNGDVQGLVVQNPLLMGYLGVMTVMKHLQAGKVEKRIDTGVRLVTAENMEEPEIHDLLHPPLEKYLK